MSLIRVPFLLSSAIGIHATFTAPTSTPTPDELLELSPRELFFKVFNANGTAFKGCFWLCTLGETASIVLPRISPSYLPVGALGLLDALGGPDSRPVSCSLIVGTTLISLAGLIRWKCYRTLGRFFTFQLSIRKGHQLVTSGPYSIVRHPSYSATILALLGVAIAHGYSGSWLRNSGVADNVWVKSAALTWVGLLSIVNISVFPRCLQEDKMMKEKFGREWKEWASKVRFRMIPGIF